MTINAADCLSFSEQSHGSDVDLEEDDSASKYLDFANADLDMEDSARARVNAVSSAKRALHRRVDSLAEGLGFEHYPSDKKDFPNKLAFCAKCGVTTPRIIGRLNTLRNKVEHDYYSPTRREAEDFVDAVALFLAATERLMNFPTELSLAPEHDDDYQHTHLRGYGLLEVDIAFDIKQKTLQVSFSRSDVNSKEEFDALFVKEKQRQQEEASKTGKAFKTQSELDEATMEALLQSLIHIQDSELLIPVSEGQRFCEWISLMITKQKEF